ncbi:MAG TPA: hypothetical protein VF316_10145 [Polyangiaceae bacterium]
MKTKVGAFLSSLALVGAIVACGGDVPTGSDASAAGDGGGDSSIKDAASEGEASSKLCGDGTPLGCTNGVVDCCPAGAPCRAPEPFCNLGGGKCTPGDC